MWKWRKWKWRKRKDEPEEGPPSHATHGKDTGGRSLFRRKKQQAPPSPQPRAPIEDRAYGIIDPAKRQRTQEEEELRGCWRFFLLLFAAFFLIVLGASVGLAAGVLAYEFVWHVRGKGQSAANSLARFVAVVGDLLLALTWVANMPYS